MSRALDAALRDLAATPRLLVALDFDGTVSDFVDDPSQARIIPPALAPLKSLERQPDTWIAFVSGRPLASLALVTGSDDGALLIGSHGAEVRLEGGRVDVGLSAEEAHRMRRLGEALDALVASVPGARLERKPVGFGVHTRQVATELVPDAHARARAAAAGIGGFLERDGKDILEFAARHATKGDGIQQLRRHVAATGVLYAGDDLTDEDGFAVLGHGDVGVKVGPGESAAEFRVADPPAVARHLALLADARSAGRSGRSGPAARES